MPKSALPPNDTNIILRIDAKLKARIVKAAAKDGRTLSGYIRHVLEKSLKDT